MGSAIKLASALLVLLALGALQLAAPYFSETSEELIDPATSHSSRDAIVLPANTASWQAVGLEDVQRGSLLFISDHGGNDDTQSDASYLLSPSLNTQVKIKVTGSVARTVLTQTFQNTSDQWLNAVYVFPLPENAAVDHLQLHIGERIIEGQIAEKQQAQQRFAEAQQQGKKASLVSQQRPNLFSNAIANIGPGETIVVNIEYQQNLPYQNQAFQLRFPLAITPRYHAQNASDTMPEEQLPTPPIATHLAENISIEVALHSGVALRRIDSEFHAIETNKLAEGHYLITLAPSAIANQDFVLNWQPELSTTAQTVHFQQTVNGQQYGLLMVYPPADTSELTLHAEREVIFVLDTSGSMAGESLKQAKTALLLALSELSPKDRFNVIEFNSYAQNLWQESKPASLPAITEARNFIVNLSANGGTEMASALNLALGHNTPATDSGIRQVVFITDGSVSNEASLMSLITEKLRNSRLFTVGIGSAPNSYFMTEAALMGKGSYTYIGSVDQVQHKMQQLLAKLAHPALTDIQLSINGQAASLQQHLEFYPSVIPDLYLGEALTLSYRQLTPQMENAQLSLQGKVQQQDWRHVLDTSPVERQSGLNVLWARHKISQLSRDQRKALMDNSGDSQTDYFRQQITQTALQHHLVSQYTSLIAVDITPSKPQNAVAVKLPISGRAGSGNVLAQLPQTATQAELNLFLGLLLLGSALCWRYVIRNNASA